MSWIIEINIHDHIAIRHRPKGKNREEQLQNRFNKAKEQAEKEPVDVEKIIKYVNEFLRLLGMEEIEDPVLKIPKEWSDWDNLPKEERNKKRRKYVKEKLRASLCEKCADTEDLVWDSNDLVWMKFTKDGFLGVVAVSNDINFHKDNTAGDIIHRLDKTWDSSFVLAFPLIGIPEKYERGDIERGIGNYLSDIRKVPILDYYSHNMF